MNSEEKRQFREANFRAGQRPNAWLNSAESLRDAAEAVFASEQSKEIAYFQARARAELEALESAASSTDGCGTAEIRCEPPNYLPGQMLSAYAMENALKGLMLANDPSLAGTTQISDAVRSHDLVKLATDARFPIGHEEQRVLEALGLIAEWAGRYPVAVRLRGHELVQPLSDPQELLDYGADHVVLRRVLTRAIDALKARVPVSSFSYSLIVRLPPGVSGGGADVVTE